ncbi:TonB-dependent receptor domain-containing protein [Paremcibacter congregatus]|uniref:Secretin/TonB short N-terminal domain-containing protein n=1 Tax=Paremcibacter congregatus TaxID=2043170 RepID=A0A2G4YS68_9PROT|nr:TonB-dependent receptor [Paremcibacter congregatus]PHZ85107.1 hypothetical protein CRD36_08480 [Paremcibacter congregatus]QDE27637.1 TonB-dependent receptor [Paremcibacter congregatus]
MKKNIFCKNILTSTVSVVALLMTAGTAQAEENFNISAQPLAKALLEFNQQSGLTVAAPSDLIVGKKGVAVRGEMGPEEALIQILSGSGLKLSQASTGAYLVTESSGFQKISYNTTADYQEDMAVYEDDERADEVEGFALEEVVVTATRRETGLNDTVGSISAIGSKEITRRNFSEMNDYLRTVPGVNFIEVGLGNNAVIVRGLGVDPQNEGITSSATTGIYFGEVSLSGLTAQGSGSDLKMIDLERVEVLRGPQGTLFGSGTLAGAVRNIPKAPNLDEFEGSVKAGYSNTAKSGGDNTKFEAVINVPLVEDKLAARVVAYRHDTSGYINNIAGTQLANDGTIVPGFPAATAVALWGGAELYQDESNLGATDYTGGRVSVLWKPVDDLSITFQHAYQKAEQKGQPYVELGLGAAPYTQVTLQLGDGPETAGRQIGHGDEIHITNVVAEYDFGWASVLSSSSWVDDKGERVQDATSFGGFPGIQYVNSSAEFFSQELRFVSQLDGPLQFVAGVYYEEVEVDLLVDTWSTTDELAAFFGTATRLLIANSAQKSADQLSFYGELSYDITEQLKVSVGARRFDYEKNSHTIQAGILGNSDNLGVFDETGTNFKASLSYTPNDDTLLYAEWAEGFRLGDASFPVLAETCDVNNDGILDGTSVPLKGGFDSDTSENFELGAKMTLLDNRLQTNIAVYQVNWVGIPVSVFGGLDQDPRVCLQAITANVGKARSRGFEFETMYQLTESLRVNLGGAYTNAKLTEDAPGLGAFAGDRLPGAADFTVNIGLQYEYDLGDNPSYVRGDYSYVNEFYNKLGEVGTRTGGYSQLNISAGVSLYTGQLDIGLFVHNLTNENALTHADTVALDDRAYRLRPRTIGINVGYNF